MQHGERPLLSDQGPRVPAAGELVAGKYRVECVLGSSEQAAVLAAHDELLDRPVALKVLPSVREDKRVARFLREARTAARLESDHIVKILDVGTLASGAPYMVLERLDGLDLGKLVDRDGALPSGRVVDYALQACEALAHAHAASIVHRDVKPQNLFLCRKADGTSLVKVVDFGIAKAHDRDENEATLTSADALLGSPAYMSPEQIQLPGSVDARSDVWSLGVVMYKLLSGEAPFAGASLEELVRNVLGAKPAPLVRPGRSIPPELAAVVMRCLERRPADRHASVLALARDLAPFGTAPRATEIVERIAFVSGEVQAPALEIARPAEETRPRRGRLALILGAAVAVVVVLAVVAAGRASRPRAEAAASATASEAPPSATASAEPVDPKGREVVEAPAEASSAAAQASDAREARARAPVGRPTHGPGAPAARPTARPSAAPAASSGPRESLPKVLGGRI